MYLGLDSSTQSLKALLIDSEAGKILSSASVNFTTDLPQYNSPNGVLENKDPLVKHSNPMLWVSALDLVLKRLQDSGQDLSQVLAISGCGQQHGSVYVTAEFEDLLKNLHIENSLVHQLENGLSRTTSPIWMDSSTSKYCEYLDSKIGNRLQTDTGSSAIERFTGVQIRKFFKEDPVGYEKTACIHLVSSFLASILSGHNCPIDFGDASGMNLLNLKSNEWDAQILEAIAPNLKDKLLPAVASNSTVGGLHSYFSKYGLKEGIPIVACTGDNPSSLIGMGAHTPGTIVISLGTSDTFFAAMNEFKTDSNGYGHVFGNPAGGSMSLICFKNGSLAREFVKDKYKVDWDYFGKDALQETDPGNQGNLMLPFIVSEITPLIQKEGVHLVGDHEFCNESAPCSQYIRAVLETQFQSMKIHSEWIGEEVSKIRVTGGASESDGICQVIADIFKCPVEKINTTDSAALGGAIRAAEARSNQTFDELADKFTKSTQIIESRNKYSATYNKHNDLVKKALQNL